MRGWRLVALVAVVLLVIGGTATVTWLVTRSGSSSTSTPDRRNHMLRGYVGATYIYEGLGKSDPFPGDPCDLVAPGNGQVIVRDANGRVVGADDMQEHGGLNPASSSPAILYSLWDCYFGFSVPVTNASFYSIKVGRWDPVTLSAARLAKLKWFVSYVCQDASDTPCTQPQF